MITRSVIPELRRLAAAGARAFGQDRRLVALISAEAPDPLQSSLQARLKALLEAPLRESGAPFLAAFSLARAVASVQAAPAPQGELRPLDNPLPGMRSGPSRRWERVALRALIEERRAKRPARVEAAREDVLTDVRVGWRLVFGLDDVAIADETELRILGLGAVFAGVLEQTLGANPSGDLRRMRLLRELDPKRAKAAAWRQLKKKPAPKPRARAAYYFTLAEDPEALPLLLRGAEKGPDEARAGALAALARRAEPEAVAAIEALLGKPGAPKRQRSEQARELPPVEALSAAPEALGAMEETLNDPGPRPAAFLLLRPALSWLRAPALVDKLRAGVLDERLPLESDGENWSRSDWAWALAAGPPSEEQAGALLQAGAHRWAGDFVVRRLGQIASVAQLSSLLPLKTRPSLARGPEVELLLWAAVRLPAAQLFELLSGTLASDTALLAAICLWSDVVHFRGPNARLFLNQLWGYWESGVQVAVGVSLRRALPGVHWDPRWWGAAERAGLPAVMAALALDKAACPAKSPQEVAQLGASWLGARLDQQEGDDNELSWMLQLRALCAKDAPQRFPALLHSVRGQIGAFPKVGEYSFVLEGEVSALIELRDVPGLDVALDPNQHRPRLIRRLEALKEDYDPPLSARARPLRPPRKKPNRRRPSPLERLRLPSFQAGGYLRPFLLAPMAGASQAAYREIALEFGAGLAPTELVSARGLEYQNTRTEDYLRHDRLLEPNFCVQIFGADPASMAKAATLAVARGAKIIDLNLGCPVKKVVRSGAGAALMRDPEVAYAVAKAVREALPSEVPLTAKIRSGWDTGEITGVQVGRRLQEAGVQAVALHARTRAQGYGGEADWAQIRALVEALSIPVIGNGDIRSVEDAERMVEETGCAAVMVGRAALGNPWIFRALNAAYYGRQLPPPPRPAMKAALILRHFRRHLYWTGEAGRAVRSFRQTLMWYAKSEPGSAAFRRQVMALTEPEAVEAAVRRFWGER